MNTKPSMGRLGNGCSTTQAGLSQSFANLNLTAQTTTWVDAIITVCITLRHLVDRGVCRFAIAIRWRSAAPWCRIIAISLRYSTNCWRLMVLTATLLEMGNQLQYQ